jgi:hypothetical protein
MIAALDIVALRIPRPAGRARPRLSLQQVTIGGKI